MIWRRKPGGALHGIGRRTACCERQLGAFAKAEELKKRIWFTLGALIVYRLGTYIPLPGIDPAALRSAFTRHSQGVLSMFNMFSGGAVQRMAIFALNIMPYISASIIIQLLTSVFPVARGAEEGRRAGPQDHQSIYALSDRGAGRVPGLWHRGRPAKGRRASSPNPGIFFRITTDDHAGRRHHVPDVARRADHRARHRQRLVADHLLRHRRGLPAGDRPARWNSAARAQLSTVLILAVVVMAIVGHRLHRVHGACAAPAADHLSEAPGGNRMYEGRRRFLPLKLNTSGVIPPIFASSLLLLPTTIANFSQARRHDRRHSFDDLALSRPRPAALYGPLRGADRLLRLLLHRDRVQPEGDGRQSEEAWRLHSRASGPASARRSTSIRC